MESVGPIRPLTPALSPEAGEREPESETCAVGLIKCFHFLTVQDILVVDSNDRGLFPFAKRLAIRRVQAIDSVKNVVRCCSPRVFFFLSRLLLLLTLGRFLPLLLVFF